MSEKTEVPTKKVKNGFFKDNTVEIVIGGKKHRVNKFEAESLKKKLNKKK